jgi:hypothetical protein
MGDTALRPVRLHPPRGGTGDGVVVAQVADIVPLGTECQPPHRRVHTVAAGDEVEGAGRGVLELRMHTVRGLGERGDRVTEQVFAAVGGALVEDGGQVAPQDLHIAAEKLAGHDGQLSPGRVEELHVGPPGLAAEDLLPHAHALQHGQLGPALEVDGLAARAQRGGALDDGDLEAVAIQPVGQGRAGDARAGDQNRLGAHGDSPYLNCVYWTLFSVCWTQFYVKLFPEML